MDVMDAGVYVSKWEARVPKTAKLTLWGPLQAKEMGLDGWEVQDGGETGFVFHNPGVRLTMGRATSTLIFVRRLERAFVTIYFGGYPTDAAAGQRRLDMQGVVNACEVFLTRLAKEPVRFQFQGEMTLVDNGNDAAVGPGKGGAAAGKLLGSGRRGGAIIDAGDETETAAAGSVSPGASADGPSWTRIGRPGGAATAKPTRTVDAEGAPRKKSGKSEVWEV